MAKNCLYNSFYNSIGGLVVGLLVVGGVGCKLDDNRLRGSIRVGSGPPPPEETPLPDPPSGLSLSSESGGLVKTVLLGSPGIVPPAHSGSPELINAAIAPPLLASGGWAALSGDEGTSAVLPVQNEGGVPLLMDVPPLVNSTSVSQSWWIAVSGVWDAAFSWSCQVLAPLAHISCSPGGFSLLASDFPDPDGGEVPSQLQIRLSLEDNSEVTSTSNSLELGQLEVQQISNTSGSPEDYDSPSLLTVFEDRLYFVSHIKQGGWLRNKLFAFDGQSQSLVQISQLQGFGNDGILWLYPKEGRLFFSGYSSQPYRKLYSYNPNSIPEQIVRHSNTTDSPWNSDVPSQPTSYNGKVFFTAANSNSSFTFPRYNKIFSYSPETNVLVQVTNTTNSHTKNDGLFDFIAPNICGVSNNKLFFVSKNLNEYLKLFSYDDLTGTVVQVSNTTGNNSLSDEVGDCRIYQDRVLFSAHNSHGVHKLYEYNDAAASNKLRLFSNTSGDETLSDGIANGFVHGDKYFFSAANEEGASKLYLYDGTEIRQISNTTQDSTSSDAPWPALAHEQKLFFSALNSQGGRKLYVYDMDGDQLHQVSDTRQDSSLPDFASNLRRDFVIYGGRLYFWALNEHGASKMFAYNLSESGLIQVTDTRKNPEADDAAAPGAPQARWIVEYQNRLYFHANNELGQGKLFSLCDLQLGCELE